MPNHLNLRVTVWDSITVTTENQPKSLVQVDSESKTDSETYSRIPLSIGGLWFIFNNNYPS
jgi:hypothetical protein